MTLLKHPSLKLTLPRPMGRFPRVEAGTAVQIDEKLAALIVNLWQGGYDTHACCEGGEVCDTARDEPYSTLAYIGFDGAEDAYDVAHRLGFGELPRIPMRRSSGGYITYEEGHEIPESGAYVEQWLMWGDSVLRFPPTQENYDRRIA